MWLLTTRGRQAETQRLLDASVATGMTHRGIVVVDGGKYPNLDVPDNWTLVENEENVGIGHLMQQFFLDNPDLPFYGWLADDFIPQTEGWDVRLAEAAGNKRIAYCNDGWDRPYPCHGHNGKRFPTWITSGFAIGGDLVRATGWFSPPLLRQAGIDSAWNNIGRKYDLQVYLHDVVIEHLHYKNGKRPRDETDNKPENEQHLWKEYLAKHQPTAMAAVARFL